jgi:desulfoferrodoxin-like iron-binding protein
MQSIHQNGHNLFFVAYRRVTPDEQINLEGIYMVNVSEEGQVFECEICGNVVKVLKVGGGELICCGEPMVLQG